VCCGNGEPDLNVARKRWLDFMMKGLDQVTGRISLGVAGCLMFGAFLAVWQRALDALAGRTVYALTAAAGIIALGLAAGLVGTWWPCQKAKEPMVLLRFIFLLMACWLVFLLSAMKGVGSGWQRILMDTTRTFSLALLTLGKTAAFFFVVPAFLAGAAGQALLQARLRSATQPCSHSLVRIFSVGVVSVWAGYLLGAGVLVPQVGVEGFTRLAALWFGALASLAVLVGAPRLSGVRAGVACLPFACVVGLLLALNTKGQNSFLTEGVFGRLVHRDSGFAQGTPFFEHHSKHHTVAVYEDADYQFVFALDGCPVLFGNRFHTARTLNGYIPLLVRPSCKKAAVLGSESGLYLPFFVRGGVTDVSYEGADAEVVKLEIAADSYVTGDGANVQANIRNGVTLSSRGAYDILFLAAEPVWMRDTRSAYSRSFFGRCRTALSADGILALHLDARALSAGRFASIATAFAAEFPGMQVWSTGAYDWLLLGGAKEIKTPVDGMLGVLEKPLVFRDLTRGGIQSLPEILACRVCDEKGLSTWLKRTVPESALLSTWRSPKAVFDKERTTLQPATLEVCRQWTTQWLLPGELDVDVFVALLDKIGRALAARVSSVTALSAMATSRSDAALDAARATAKINPHDALLFQLSEALELEARRRIKIGDFKGGVKCYENLLSFSAGKAQFYYGLAYCLRANGENETAYLHFARAVAAAPEQTGYRVELAQVALSIGEFAEADRQYQEALKREPDNPDFLFRYAKGLALKDRPDKNMAKSLKLAERACVLTEWKNTEYAYGLADLYMDAGRVLEGMGLKRRLKEGFSSKGK
jgi:hypothetical protein